MTPADDEDEDGFDESPDAVQDGGSDAAGTQRLDKWLWFVRLVKTRSMAQRLVTDGGVRVNRNRVDKPAYALKVGDVVTVTLDRRVRVLQMKSPGIRRGSATDAQLLYEDMTPPPEPRVPLDPAKAAHPMSEAGRPSKRDRREIERVKDRWRP